MKKMLFFAALAAVMASCTSEEPMMVSNGTAIGFDTYVGKATRAGDINTANLASFYVYGGKTATDFNGTEVTKADNAWTYSPTQYWEKDAKYTFAAVAPTTSTGVSFDGSKLTVADYTPGDDDLIVAVTNTITGKEAGSNAAVNLNFKHTLSKVQLTFSGDASKVSNVKLSGVSNKATLDVTYSSGTAPVWGTAASTGDYAYTLTNGKDVKFLLPQTLSGAKVSFTYEGETKELGIDASAVSEWEMGKGYNYTVKLPETAQESIAFEVAVEDAWTDYTSGSFVANSETMIIEASAASWIRMNKPNEPKNTDNDMELHSSKDDAGNYTDRFFGLLQFTLPDALKGNSVTINDVKLRLVTTYCKATNYDDTQRMISIHQYTGTEAFDEKTATYNLLGSACEKIVDEEDALTTFAAKGNKNKAMGDASFDAGYDVVEAWTNYIQSDKLTKAISDKLNPTVENSSDDSSNIVFILSRDQTATIKIGTHRYYYIEAGNSERTEVIKSRTDDNDNLLYKFLGRDIIPQLTITYTKEAE